MIAPLLVHTMTTPRLSGGVWVGRDQVLSEPRVWIDAEEVAAWLEASDLHDAAETVRGAIAGEHADHARQHR